MIVYRVENRSVEAMEESRFDNVGAGAYGLFSIAFKICSGSSDSSDSTHPTPDEEYNLVNKFTREHVCCFKSISQLRTWFDEIDEGAENYDLSEVNIATYIVPDEHYHAGRWQSIALASEMTLLELHPITYRG
jgi:hypothetical protein